MFGEYLLLELMLISAAGFSLLWGNKGIIVSLSLVSIINYLANYSGPFWYYQVIILLIGFAGLVLNYILDKKTEKLKVLKVTTGSAASAMIAVLFLPFLPAILLWLILIGIPLMFNKRRITGAFYLQIIFKFIFSTGWIIIGNIIY